MIGAFWQSFWVEGNAIQKPEVVQAALAKALGETDAKAMFEKVCLDHSPAILGILWLIKDLRTCQTSTKEIKDLLGKNTDAAFAEGAFGLPYFLATNAEGEKEGFWGFDHLAQVTQHLGLERPQPGSAEEGGWRAML